MLSDGGPHRDRLPNSEVYVEVTACSKDDVLRIIQEMQPRDDREYIGRDLWLIWK